MADISSWLKDLRKRQGLSQKEFAARCGISQSVLSEAERGQSNLRSDSLGRISSAFGEEPPLIGESSRPADFVQFVSKARERIERLQQMDSFSRSTLERCAGAMSKLAQEVVHDHIVSRACERLAGHLPNTQILIHRLDSLLRARKSNVATDSPAIGSHDGGAADELLQDCKRLLISLSEQIAFVAPTDAGKRDRTELLRRIEDLSMQARAASTPRIDVDVPETASVSVQAIPSTEVVVSLMALLTTADGLKKDDRELLLTIARRFRERGSNESEVGHEK